MCDDGPVVLQRLFDSQTVRWSEARHDALTQAGRTKRSKAPAPNNTFVMDERVRREEEEEDAEADPVRFRLSWSHLDGGCLALFMS